MARIKAKNVDKELSRELLLELEHIASGVKDKSTLKAIGDGIVGEMKSMISKGISPIEGAGRFPEYKVKTLQRNAQNAIKAARAGRAATKKRAAEAKKLTKRTRLAAKALKFAGRVTGSKRVKAYAKDVSRRGKQSALKARLLNSRARREQSAIGSRVRAKKEIKGYPYTVQKKFPAKKPRPVNLFLSGKFLSRLAAFVLGAEKDAKLQIGFTDFQAEQIEEGHRIGWLGQGKRPIIPQGNEKFAQRIQRVAEKILGQVLATKLLTRRR